MSVIAVDREIRRAENCALKTARRQARVFRRDLIKRYESTRTVRVDLLAEMFADPLAESMYIGHLLGSRRAALDARGNGLKLSRCSDQIRGVLERVTSIENVERVKQQYQTRALDIVWRLTDAVEKRVRNAIGRSAAEGYTVKGAIKEIRKELATAGVTDVQDYQIETVYRTQTQFAYSAGRFETYQEPEIDEILWGYKYYTAGDDRVRPSHEALDGTTLPKNHPFWDKNTPPNGWNCRCQVIAVFEERKIVEPRSGFQADPGFEMNPGRVISSR